MAQYWLPATEERIYSYYDLKKRFPNVSIPQNVDVPDLGAYIVHYVDPPEYDPETQYPDEGNPALNEDDGHYYQTWVIKNISDIPPDPPTDVVAPEGDTQ